jgi:hypothetical protein
MAGNSGESNMDATKQVMAKGQHARINMVVRAMRVIYLACLICWPQIHIAVCRLFGT